MKTINCFNNMREYGIDCLTGEACGLGMRLLCDYTKKGATLIAKAYGFGSDFKGGEAWNRGTTADPHVGSIMLTNNELMTLGVFALLENGCDEVYVLSPNIGFLETIKRTRRAVEALLLYAGPPEKMEQLARTIDPSLYHRALEEVKGLGRFSMYSDDTVYGFERIVDDNERRQEWLTRVNKDGWSARRYAYHGTARGGDRNTHMMSGRDE